MAEGGFAARAVGAIQIIGGGLEVAFGGRIGDTASPWRSELDKCTLDRPWSSLIKRQRFFLRLPTIGRWRPLDFLAAREG